MVLFPPLKGEETEPGVTRKITALTESRPLTLKIVPPSTVIRRRVAERHRPSLDAHQQMSGLRKCDVCTYLDIKLNEIGASAGK